MALFKILKGNSGNLPTAKNDGWCYVTLDEHKMYIDTSTERFALNAVHADTATALTTSAGSATQPIYFSNGKPVAITGTIANNISGNAATASSVAWSNVSGKPSTFTPSSHTHDDRYYTESEVDSKLAGKAPSSHTHNYAGSSSAGGSATSAVKLDTSAGSSTKPVYFSGGKPTACVDFLPLSAGEGKKLTGALGLTENVNYGTSLPSTGFNGQLFFLEGDTGGSGSYLPLSGGTLTGNLNIQIPGESNKMELWSNSIDACLTCTNITTNNKMVLAIKESSKELMWQYYTASTDSWEGHKLWKEGDSVTGAVWNDYAECRESDCEEFGYVLTETGNDTLTKTTERLQHFAGVSSDTWGFSQGETAHARTPIAVAGRVLVYTYQDRNNYKPGDCVCAAPGGTVDIMTREEVREWPDRIVGTVSCVPTYEEWGGGEGADREPVKVDGRIWIKVM